MSVETATSMMIIGRYTDSMQTVRPCISQAWSQTFTTPAHGPRNDRPAEGSDGVLQAPSDWRLQQSRRRWCILVRFKLKNRRFWLFYGTFPGWSWRGVQSNPSNCPWLRACISCLVSYAISESISLLRVHTFTLRVTQRHLRQRQMQLTWTAVQDDDISRIIVSEMLTYHQPLNPEKQTVHLPTKNRIE